MDFCIIEQLLVLYSALIKYSKKKKNGNTVGSMSASYGTVCCTYRHLDVICVHLTDYTLRQLMLFSNIHDSSALRSSIHYDLWAG